jgi:plastocyanin
MKSIVIPSLLLTGLLTPLAIVPASGAGGPYGRSPQQTEPVLVRIEIEGDSVRAVPDTVTVRPGQRVEWVTDIGDWTVRFTGPNPFPPAAAEDGIQGARGQRNGAAVRGDAAEGRYKYMILVRDGERMRIRDPEVIVAPAGDPGR